MKNAAVFLAILSLVSGTSFAVTVWDESIHGDLSDAPGAPTPIVVSFGANTILGSIGGPIVPDVSGLDDFTFTVADEFEVFSITLDAYGPEASNMGLFNLYQGPLGSGVLLDSAVMSTANVGSNLLEAGPLGPGEYTIDLREGGSEQNYGLTINIVPEPSTSMLFLAGLVMLAGRRRRS